MDIRQINAAEAMFDAGGWVGDRSRLSSERQRLSEEPYTEREVIGASDCHILMLHQSGALPALTIYTQRHKHTEGREEERRIISIAIRSDF